MDPYTSQITTELSMVEIATLISTIDIQIEHMENCKLTQELYDIRVKLKRSLGVFGHKIPDIPRPEKSSEN